MSVSRSAQQAAGGSSTGSRMDRRYRNAIRPGSCDRRYRGRKTQIITGRYRQLRQEQADSHLMSSLHSSMPSLRAISAYCRWLRLHRCQSGCLAASQQLLSTAKQHVNEQRALKFETLCNTTKTRSQAQTSCKPQPLQDARLAPVFHRLSKEAQLPCMGWPSLHAIITQEARTIAAQRRSSCFRCQHRPPRLDAAL